MPTFLYTDIEGSTQLWEKHGQAMGAVLDRHDQILMDCVELWGGEHVKNTGDGMMVVFHSGEALPLDCALAMQRRLLGDDHLHVAFGLNSLANLLQRRSDLDAAEPALREALEIFRRRLGDEHQNVIVALIPEEA